METIELGVDASGYEPIIDWQTARNHGVSFASIRASWGTTGVDYCFQAHMLGALNAGIQRIPYHWFDNRLPGLEQARNFLAHFEEGEHPSMVDLENYGSNVGYHGIERQVKIYLDTVEDGAGRTPLIYTSPVYIKSYLYDAFTLLPYPLVIAHWDAAAPLIPRPFIPLTWFAWQYTGKGAGPFYGYTRNKNIALYVRRA